MFRECFIFNVKIHLRSLAFLLAAAASIVFTVLSQRPYFAYYPLTEAADMQQIHDRLPIDATVPADGDEQIRLTLASLQALLQDELMLPNPSPILADLTESLSARDEWSLSELDALWAELVAKYGELTMLTPQYLSNSFVNHCRKTVTLEELFQYAYAEHTFSDYLSVEFGQSLSLILSILFVVFFSTLFLSDVRPGLSNVLHLNVTSAKKMVYGKYLSALSAVTGCIGLDLITISSFLRSALKRPAPYRKALP